MSIEITEKDLEKVAGGAISDRPTIKMGHVEQYCTKCGTVFARVPKGMALMYMPFCPECLTPTITTRDVTE